MSIVWVMYDMFMDAEEKLATHQASRSSGGILGFIIFAVVCWYGYTHWIHKTTWTAIYYPIAADSYDFQSESVGSLEGCQNWVDARAQATGNTGYDYECGTECKIQYDATGKFYRCKEIQR